MKNFKSHDPERNDALKGCALIAILLAILCAFVTRVVYGIAFEERMIQLEIDE